MLQVRELGPDERTGWDELIAASPQGNSFLRTAWLDMLCKTDTDLHSQTLGCFDGERLVGGQALVWHTRWNVPMAATFEYFYCGPVVAAGARATRASHAPVQNAILAALAQATATRLAHVEMDAHPTLCDVRPYLDARWRVEPTYTHVWHVDSIERAWSEMNREKRREIKHAQNEFVFERDDSDAALDAWLPLYRKTMEKFSWYPSPRWTAIFQKRFAWLRERDAARLYIARRRDGELSGGVVTLLSRDDRTAYLFKQGSDPQARDLGMIPALYWHTACQVAAEFPNVDFGGSPLPSLGRFKDYLGAQSTLHFRLSHQRRDMRLKLYESARAAKDQIYVRLMHPAHGRFQDWWYQIVRRGYAG